MNAHSSSSRLFVFAGVGFIVLGLAVFILNGGRLGSGGWISVLAVIAGVLLLAAAVTLRRSRQRP